MQTPTDIHTLVQTALTKHPVRVVARVLGVAPATVSALALPGGLCRCQRGSIALAQQHAPDLEALLAA